MYLKIFISLSFLLGETLAMKIGIGKNQTLNYDLKSCLLIVMDKVCPDCSTAHVVIPTKSSSEVDVLINQLSDALTIRTVDHPAYEDPLFDQIGMYLANTVQELKTALNHLEEAKVERNYVIWVNFSCGYSFSSFLKNTFPKSLDIGKAWGIIFVALIDGNVQVFGTPVPMPRDHDAQKLTKLDVCDKKAPAVNPQPNTEAIESPKTVIRVIMQPVLLPFIERQTDNPGGAFEYLINVLKEKLNFTPKYDWSLTTVDFPKLRKMNDLHMVFNLVAKPKGLRSTSGVILMSEAYWVVATRDPFEKRNILATPFKNDISSHLLLFAIYTSLMVYLCRDVDNVRLVLRLFGMFFAIAVDWFPRKGLFRCLVVLWCFASYILVQTYLAALTSELSYPTVDQRFRDTNDLMKAGIEIFCLEGMKELYCHLTKASSRYICKKCKIMHATFFPELQKLHSNKTWRPFGFHVSRFVFESTLAKKPFGLIPQRISSWPGTIDSNAGEEFLGAATNICTWLFESGILYHWLEKYYIKNRTDYEYEPDMLNMTNLNDIFVILYVGWACSIAIFIIEISI